MVGIPVGRTVSYPFSPISLVMMKPHAVHSDGFGGTLKCLVARALLLAIQAGHSLSDSSAAVPLV